MAQREEAKPPNLDAQVVTAVEAINKSKPVGSPAHYNAVKALRTLLATTETEIPPVARAVEVGAIPSLVAALQPPINDQTSQQTVYEACWCIINIAAFGDTHVIKALLPAAPLLIALSGGPSPIAEQCAWVLGNVAAEDKEYRELLIANGALYPLVSMVISAADSLEKKGTHPPDEERILAGATAAWALSTLLKSAGRKEIGECMGIPGSSDALIFIMQSQDVDPRLVIEVAWVLAYLTAGPEAHTNRLVHLGLVPSVLARLVDLHESGPCLENEKMARAMMIPLVRCLGNICAGGATDAIKQLIPMPHGDEDAEVVDLKRRGMAAILGCLQAHHFSLQREGAWVLSNVAGMPGKAGVEFLKSVGALPVLMRLLKSSPFHVQKEAAYALANVAAGGGGGGGDVETLIYLFESDAAALKAMTTSMMLSADMDAARLGLQFTDMFLRHIPNTRHALLALEMADALLGLDRLQFGANVPCDLQKGASSIIDTYFGEDTV